MTYRNLQEENFNIEAIKDENGKLLHFIVTDRNGERVSDKTFEFSSDATMFGQDIYEELVK